MDLKDILFQISFRMIILATIVHEYGHLLSLRLMGYRGVINSGALNMVTALDYNLMSSLEKHLFFIAGGLFQCMIFLIMCIFDKDEENRLVNKMIVIQGFVYMLFEAFATRIWWETGAVLGILLSSLFMVLVSRAKYNQTQ